MLSLLGPLYINLLSVSDVAMSLYLLWTLLSCLIEMVDTRHMKPPSPLHPFIPPSPHLTVYP